MYDPSASLAALDHFAILDTPPEEAFDRMTALAARVFAVPMALVSFLDKDRQWFKSHHGTDVCETPLSVSFCVHAARANDILVVPDATQDPRFAENPLVTGDLNVRFYAGAPLRTPDGLVLGTLCIIDTKPRIFGPADRQTLSDLAAMLERELSLRHATRQLRASVQATESAREARLAAALEQAERDHLTGLWNHRAFHKRLADEAERARRGGTTLAAAVLDIHDFKFFNDTHGHAAGDDVLQSVADLLHQTNGSRDTLARFGGNMFALLVPGASRADLTERLTHALRGLSCRPPGAGVDVPISVAVGTAALPDDGTERLDILALALSRLHRAKQGEADEQIDRLRGDLTRRREGFSMLDALVTAVDNKDRYTRRHSEDVCRHALCITRQMRLSSQMQHTVEVAALLHDVGKIGVPDRVLRKPAALTDAEFEAIKQHPMMGAIIVGAVPGFEETLDAIRHHHERWDGQGYPFGLAGTDIPFLARLMAVADAYSAMTTDRPYRKGMSADKALSLLQNGSGTQWDAGCVAAFAAACQSTARAA